MRNVKYLLIIVFIAAVAAITVVRSGAYDVAATNPHSTWSSGALHTVMRYSVKARATGIAVPRLDDPALIKSGFGEYHEMCEGCHGAPGVQPGEAGQGLMPRAPDLARTASTWTDQELFWIVKNGVRMTGMPAWGPTHDDKELWTTVAFVRRLPSLSAHDYQTLVRETRGMDMHHGKDAH